MSVTTVLVIVSMVNVSVVAISFAAIDASQITNLVLVLTWSSIVLRVSELVGLTVMGSLSVNKFAMAEDSSVKVGLSVGLELLSLGFRSISLGFRLLANLSAGHVIFDLANFVRFTDAFALTSLAGSIPALRIVALQLYEGVVCTIQLGVF